MGLVNRPAHKHGRIQKKRAYDIHSIVILVGADMATCSASQSFAMLP